jgi:hypothetical protein
MSEAITEESPRGNPPHHAYYQSQSIVGGLQGSFAIRADHAELHAQTWKRAMSDKSRNDKCSWLKSMINWIKEHYPAAADVSNERCFIRPIIYIYKLLFCSGWLYLRHGGKTKPTWEQRSHTLGKGWGPALWGRQSMLCQRVFGWKVV